MRWLPNTDKGRAIALGMVGLATGLALWWPPAALIVTGLLLIALGLIAPPEPDK